MIGFDNLIMINNTILKADTGIRRARAAYVRSWSVEKIDFVRGLRTKNEPQAQYSPEKRHDFALECVVDLIIRPIDHGSILL